MGFLSQYSKTERVDLGDKYYAVVRVFLPSEAELEAQKKLAKLSVLNTGDANGVSVNTEFDQGAYLYEVAAHALIEWNLDDENDQVLPFGTLDEKRASMRRLPKYVVDQIVAEVKDRPVKDPDFRPEAASSNTDG